MKKWKMIMLDVKFKRNINGAMGEITDLWEYWCCCHSSQKNLVKTNLSTLEKGSGCEKDEDVPEEGTQAK